MRGVKPVIFVIIFSKYLFVIEYKSDSSPLVLFHLVLAVNLSAPSVKDRGTVSAAWDEIARYMTALSKTPQP